MNMIQDMIESGFEVLSITESEFELKTFRLYSVSVYDINEFGIFFKGIDSYLSRIQFRANVYPWDYGDKDYRILNEGEIETLKKLISVLKL